MKRFLIALQFLTVLPVKVSSAAEEKDYGASLAYFPLVGLLLGAILALCTYPLDLMPRLVSCAVILIVSIVLTGGIHLDGFADTCDGLCGHRTREKALEIMRDSCTGAMGASGITLLLLLKFALLVSLPGQVLWKFLVLMTVFARWAQVLACSSSPYAREEGKAKYFVEYAGWKETVTGGLFTIALFFILMNFAGLGIFVVSFLAVFLVMTRIKRRIGGMTGDTIGAVSETGEVIVLLSGLVFTGVFHAQ